MGKTLNKLFKKIKLWHLILLFFLLNLLILPNFPFIHSDEAWLSGLSRQILETGSFASTESFFDLLPRYPHAIKIFFHFLQIIFMKIFGYKIFSFRLISLLSSSLAAYFFYKIMFFITKSKKISLAALLILLTDIQFIYSSHLARQEAILVLIFLAAFYYFLKKQNQNISQDFNLGLIIAVGIGFHPNSFIIALPFILIYSFQLFTEKINFKNYFVFGMTLTSAAAFFILLSFYFDPQFISHYSSYGSQLGVFDSLIIKAKNLKNFYLKLFHQISGTYYLPPIKFQLIFFSISFLAAFYNFFRKKDKVNFYLLSSILAINIGYLIIGRYNQTSIIFIFPLFYLLFINLIKNLKPKLKIIIISILVLVLAFNSLNTLIEDSHFNYEDYLAEISETVNKDQNVLANLNADYYFNNNTLHDYRNLSYLAENNLSFADYIKKNEIKYIIYPEEMDFIYNTRPKWNFLYGNLYPYYQEMKEFIAKKTSLKKEFYNQSYGIRIANKIGDKKYKIKIYQVDK